MFANLSDQFEENGEFEESNKFEERVNDGVAAD